MTASGVLVIQCMLGALPTLVDHPIASGIAPIYLDGDWTATNSGGPEAALPLPARVPGDILTDLQRAGRVGDPYWNTTWQEPGFIAAWNTGTWSYRKRFATPSSSSDSSYLLVLDGIRMGAMVRLNDRFLGNATDQFVRYAFAVPQAALQAVGGPAENELEITFGAELGIDCGGRWTYSAQIDWAPVMLTTDNSSKRATFGFGIWKSVYLLPVPAGGAAITHLAPQTFYQGGHPIERLADDSHAGFDVRVTLELHAPESGEGTVSVLGDWPGATAVSARATLKQGSNTIVVTIPASQSDRVKLWHPNGHGAQPLYTINATYASAPTRHPGVSAVDQLAVASTSRRIGFRHAVLITTNDTDPDVVAGAPHQNGTGQFTMFFRVNGAAVYARGANKVPMDLMEGRLTADGHRRLVRSAAEGRYNMLRVWGGGIWEPQVFYDACDELGVMVYHDAMFTFGEVGFEPTVYGGQLQAELEHQVRRLSHHPAVVHYTGCNECIYHDNGGDYEALVTTRIAATDPSRTIAPHSPMPDGWASGVDRLTTRPKPGQTFVAGVKPAGVGRPANYSFAMEGHGPYVATTAPYAGARGRALEAIMPSPGPILVHVPNSYQFYDTAAEPSWTGVQHEGWFESEFGVVSWPSFESASATLPEDQWGLDSRVAKTRNWNPVIVIQSMFGVNATARMACTGEAAFKRQLYQSQIGQALLIKTLVEAWRSTNNFGTIFWMFNEIWPTGGWGSIEYGARGVPGQIEGGRWKPLHYQLRASVFADRMSTCTTAGACFVTNDSPFPFHGSVGVILINVWTGRRLLLVNHTLLLGPGAGVTEWFCASNAAAATADSTDKTRGDGPASARRPAPAVTFTSLRRPSYTISHDRIPVGGNAAANSSMTHGALNSTTCEDACTASLGCVGFTVPNAAGYRCWFYDYVPRQLLRSGANWFQKVSPPVPPSPSPPPPPPPLSPSPPPPPPCRPPPPELECTGWNKTAEWASLGCDVNGTNCLLLIEVWGSDSSSGGSPGAGSKALASRNVLPFVPPKDMHLPAATVEVIVGAPHDDGETVPITLQASATVLYAVMTTRASGRFSDNMVLLEAGASAEIDFISWNGAVNSTGLALLKSSLRVEHLQNNL